MQYLGTHHAIHWLTKAFVNTAYNIRPSQVHPGHWWHQRREFKEGSRWRVVRNRVRSGKRIRETVCVFPDSCSWFPESSQQWASNPCNGSCLWTEDHYKNEIIVTYAGGHSSYVRHCPGRDRALAMSQLARFFHGHLSLDSTRDYKSVLDNADRDCEDILFELYRSGIITLDHIECVGGARLNGFKKQLLRA